MTVKPLKTERLILRDIETTDLESIFEFNADPEVVRFLPWGPNSAEQTQAFIREVLQTLDAEADLVFTPHLMPMIRGIHATVYADACTAADEVQTLFEDYYRDEPFVDVMPAGSHPETRSVRGANICRLAVHYLASAKKYVVLSVEDNLVKGAAGQAIQNMNLMFGLDETAGLDAPGLTP